MTFKKWLIILILLLLLADIAILLDVSVLRQVLGFLCFSILPGLLILHILKLNEIGFLRSFLLSVGLSVSFLIFAGLLVNFLLPWLGNPRPLSTLSLVISLSVIIAILCFGAYWRNRKSGQFGFALKLGEDFRGKQVAWLLLPVLFPFLTVFGRRVLDAGGSNAILLALFLLIPCYMVVLLWQSRNVPKLTYPLAIWMISLSLLLARGLISNYLVGGDIYVEYHSFQVVSKNLHWAVEAEGGAAGMMSATLSVSLLPAMLQSILGIGSLYIYKVVLLVLISLIPVIGYVIYDRYLAPPYGFLSAFFFIAQLPFIYLLSGQIRVGISLISLSLAIMVLFDDRIVGFKRSALYLLFLFSLVVEYYVLPLIFLALMFILWLVPKTWKSRFPSQTVSIISAVLLPAVFIYFWWGQVTATSFEQYIYFAKEIVSNLANFFVEEARGGIIASLYTPATHLTWVAQVPGLVQRLSFVAIAIGVLSILARREQRAKLGNFAVLMVASLGPLVAYVVLPWASTKYGADRFYLQCLVALAPAFTTGCQEISNGIRAAWVYSTKHVRLIFGAYPLRSAQLKLLLPVVSGVLLVSLFFSSSHVYHQFLFRSNTREILDPKSVDYALAYVADGEVQAARWLGANNPANYPIYVGNRRQPASNDIFEYTEYGISGNLRIIPFMRESPLENSYIFLGRLNVVNGLAIVMPLEAGVFFQLAPLSEFTHLYAYKNKIYANGGAEIYR